MFFSLNTLTAISGRSTLTGVRQVTSGYLHRFQEINLEKNLSLPHFVYGILLRDTPVIYHTSSKFLWSFYINGLTRRLEDQFKVT